MTHVQNAASKKRTRSGRKLYFLLVLAMGLLVLSACSAGGATDPKAFLYTVNPDDSATITGISGNIKNMTIPDVIDGHTVTAIAENAFSKNMNLERVTIPETVTAIGSYAFKGCKNLLSVQMPQQIGEMGIHVFGWCEYLEKINLPTNLRIIPDSTFTHCEYLTEIAIPDSVEAIGNAAFSNCKELKRVDLPNGVLSIGEDCFYQCELLAAVTLPSGLTAIPRRAFNGCSKLQALALPASVSLIEDQAFSGCHLMSTFEIPDTVTRLTGNPFTTCREIKLSPDHPTLSLRDGVLVTAEGALVWYPFQSKMGDEYHVPQGVTAINSHAFSMANVSRVVLPDTVLSIEESAFGNYRQLEEVVIPASVAFIGDMAMDGKTTMIVEAGSYAEEWALKKGHLFAYAAK